MLVGIRKLKEIELNYLHSSYDKRSWSLDSITYYGELKQALPALEVDVKEIDNRRRVIGLPPIYLYVDYWEDHKAGFEWYREAFLKGVTSSL
jgi:hypothetical protein